MNTNINDLASVHEAVARKNELTAMQAQLERERIRIERDIRDYTSRVERKEADVRKLEKPGFTTLKLALTGKREAMLQEELDNVGIARMKLAAARKEMEDNEGRMYELAAEQDTFAGCEERFARLFGEKLERLLAAGQQETTARIRALTGQISDIKGKLEQIAQAMTVAESARARLSKSLDSLCEADDWGAYDVLGIGIAGYIKHDHMEDAMVSAIGAQVAIEKLKNEIDDVSLPDEVSVNVSKTARFFDLYMDGYFADMFMQNEINESMDNVSLAMNAVSKARRKLEALRDTENGRLHQLGAELETLVIHTPESAAESGITALK